MTALVALIKREYLEHRGAFLVGPTLLLILATLAAVYAALDTDFGAEFDTPLQSTLAVYQVTMAVGGIGWLLYLIVMLFFYYSGAFSADRRDNAMLFWKSMPQTDLKIMGSKVAASLTIFPATMLLALAITGLVAYLPTMVVSGFLPGFAPPSLGEMVVAWLNIMLTAPVFFLTVILWYLPFFAWVGFLSTVFKRWSLPLAVLVPAVLDLFERVVTRDFLDTGRIWNFLSQRFEFQLEGINAMELALQRDPWSVVELIRGIFASVDWTAMVGGLAVAGAFVILASEYRRRYVLT